MKIFIAVLLTFFLFGCTSNSKDEITGKWLMYKVFQGGSDVTLEHDPYDERFLILNVDSSFESGGRPHGKNTGRYVFEAAENTLFIDSDAGPEDDSHWKVFIQGDSMHWQGYGSEWALAFEIIHKRENN